MDAASFVIGLLIGAITMLGIMIYLAFRFGNKL